MPNNCTCNVTIINVLSLDYEISLLPCTAKEGQTWDRVVMLFQIALWDCFQDFLSICIKKLNHWIMQCQGCDWLSHHGIWANIPCSPNMVTVRVCWKLNTSWKSVVFTNKVGKNSPYFVGAFNKTIIPPALVGYEMIIANSALPSHI